MNSLLSIVIPTRNRPNMLSYSLNSALAYQDFAQILVVSNGDALKSDIPNEFMNSKNIQIERSESRLSMSENWKFGYKFVNSDWVYFLGDDDIMTINPEILHSILRLESSDGIVFAKKFFRWNDSLSELPININEPLLPSQVIHPKVPNKLNWLTQHLNKYPSGAGSSIVRRSFLDSLNSNGFLFQGVSPDWSNAAYFLHYRKNFRLSENNLVSIGLSDVSSIQLYRNPQSIEARTQIQLTRARVSPGLANFPVDCPTTWLSRIDSMYKARVNLHYPIIKNSFLLAVSALITTPRYVIFMCNYLRRAGYGKLILSLIFIPMIALALLNKLKFLMINFYRKYAV